VISFTSIIGIQSAEVLPGLHRMLRRISPEALWMGNPNTRQIALTFDDGPHPEDTMRLLDILDHWQVPGTFFQVGERVERYPEQTRAVAAAGHQIALHGYWHRPFLHASKKLHDELSRTQSAISSLTGRPRSEIRDVRPPKGLYTPEVLSSLNKWGFRTVMWTLVPMHWMHGAHWTIRHVTQHIRGGTILVLHEGLGGPPVGELTQKILSDLVPRGYEWVSIDQLWKSKNTARLC
jgi:peptidoglycan/xylan/chitin deacetylase (PgdA/CDA1 family)